MVETTPAVWRGGTATRRAGRASIALLLCTALLASVAVRSQTIAPGSPEAAADDAFASHLVRWKTTLERIGERLEASAISRADIAPLNDRLRALQESIIASRDDAAGRAAAERELLEALGPPPGEDDPPEDAALADERESIRQELAHHRSAEKQTELLLARLNALFERMVDVEYETLLGLLSRQTVYPLSLETLTEASAQLAARVELVSASIADWWTDSDRVRLLPLVGLSLLLAVGLFGVRLMRRWRRAWQARPPSEVRPNRGQRFVMAIIYIGERGLIPAAMLAAMAALLQSQTIFGTQFHLKASGLLWTAARLVLTFGVVAALLAPRDPRWRSTAFSDEAARGLYRAVRLYVIVVLAMGSVVTVLHPSADIGGSLSEEAIASYFSIYPELSSSSALLILVAFAATLLHVLRPRHWRFVPDERVVRGTVDAELDDADTDADELDDPAEEESDRWARPASSEDAPDDASSSDEGMSRAPSRLSRLGLALARVALLASLVVGVFGFLNAGVYIADRTAATIGLVALALMARNLVATGLYHATAADSNLGLRLRRRLVLDDAGTSRLTFWLLLVFDTIVIIGGLVALALLWGLPLAELQLLSNLVVYGVTVGGYSLSVTNVLLAAAVFALLLTAVRVFRSVLSARILTQTRLDVGARDAVTAIVGYVGLTIAALVALTLLGIDFGRLALILGALSVGIGFGLQHVVSNFVSGLILLATRPIKSGDWIVVGQYQGYVKQINVVTTEIQTFDNAAVLVPNSSLVSNDVLNWTHKSTVGRVIVTVRAGFESPPEEVRRVLWRCVRANRDVLRRPAPLVLFMGFGNSALDFEIRFFIREIDNVLVVSSDLRYRIVDAFRDAGITIPFPQHDVHLHDVRTGAGHEDLSDTSEISARDAEREPVATGRDRSAEPRRRFRQPADSNRRPDR